MSEHPISQLCETLQVSRSWYYEKQVGQNLILRWFCRLYLAQSPMIRR